MRRWTVSLLALALTAALSACGGDGPAEPGKPLASEACGFLLDAAKVLVSNDPPSEKADVIDRAVDKAVKVAHRAYNANPEYREVLRGANMTKEAVKSGDSKEIAAALKSATATCARTLRVSS
jgi:hypothetical protein